MQSFCSKSNVFNFISLQLLLPTSDIPHPRIGKIQSVPRKVSVWHTDDHLVGGISTTRTTCWALTNPRVGASSKWNWAHSSSTDTVKGPRSRIDLLSAYATGSQLFHVNIKTLSEYEERKTQKTQVLDGPDRPAAPFTTRIQQRYDPWSLSGAEASLRLLVIDCLSFRICRNDMICAWCMSEGRQWTRTRAAEASHPNSASKQ